MDATQGFIDHDFLKGDAETKVFLSLEDWQLNN